jgi:hypothetical protein
LIDLPQRHGLSERLETLAGVVFGTMLVALAHELIEFLFLSGISQVHFKISLS